MIMGGFYGITISYEENGVLYVTIAFEKVFFEFMGIYILN